MYKHYLVKGENEAINEPTHEIIVLIGDQRSSGEPAHLRSLARAFSVRTHEVWKQTKGPTKIRHLAPLDRSACAFEE